MSDNNRIELLRKVHERWQKKRKKEDAVADDKRKCELCGKIVKQVRKLNGMETCSMCQNMISNVKLRPEMAVDLLRRFHGDKYFQVTGAGACDPDRCDELERARTVLDAYHDVLMKTAAAVNLPEGKIFSDLPAAAMELRRRTVVPVENDLCEPEKCEELAGALKEELAGAIKELLAVRQALGDYAPEAEEPGDMAVVIKQLVERCEVATSMRNEYGGMLDEIALALDGGTGTGGWTDMVEQVQRLVESRVSTLETINDPVPATGVQVGGRHYVDLAIGPTEYSQRNGLGCCESAVVKYVTRHKRKGGLEDIRKAVHYLQLLEEIEYPAQGKELVPPLPAVEHAEGVEHD